MTSRFKECLVLLEALVHRAAHMLAWLTMLALLIGLAMVNLCLPVIALALLGAFRRRPKPLWTHGTARFANYVDLLKAGCLNNQGGLLLGKAMCGSSATLVQSLKATFCWPLSKSVEAVKIADSRCGKSQSYEAYLPDDGPPHLAVIGASGSGKSTTFCIPNLLRDSASAVVIDIKGELLRLTGHVRARRFGHRIVVFDPFRIASDVGFPADQFNPLDLCTDELLIVDECRRLANALIVRNKNDQSPFFNDASQVLIQGALAFLKSEALEEEANLNRLRDILTNRTLTDGMLKHMENSESCDGLLQRLAGQIRWFQGNTEASVYAVANTHLEFLDSIPIARALARTSFDPRELLHGNMTVYLCLPVDRIKELGGLQRILLTSLINHIFAAGESRSRIVRFYLDEAASLQEVEALYSALVYGRSFGMRLFFLMQSASQIQLCFPESKAADFKSTVASIFCGTNDYQTAEEISKWIGQTTVQSTSVQSGTNLGDAHNVGIHEMSRNHSFGRSTSRSTNEIGRALIQPEEVLQIPSSQAIVLLPNVRPFLCEKLPWFRRRTNLMLPVKRTLHLLRSLVLIFVLGPLLTFSIWASTIGRDSEAVRSLVAEIQAAMEG